jgi:hypothetical protein
MAVTKVIRYQTKPECADENERLIRNVFAELNEENPKGLRYAAFRLEDQVSFLHIAVLEGDENPLTTSKAFGQFQSDIASRIVEGPVQSDATVIGSYRVGSDLS